MYYAKIKNVNHDEAVTIINAAVAAQGLSMDNLVIKMKYPFQHKGIEDLKLFFAGNHPNENQIRQRIGVCLGIDHELLHGERGFERYEDYCRCSFRPHLVRIPEDTRPSQITMFGFIGFERVFVAGAYEELLNKNIEEQLPFIQKQIANDFKERKGSVLFFGKILGYAFFSDYEKAAIPLSVKGEVLEDMVVSYSGPYSASVTVKGGVVTDSGSFQIPRLSPKRNES